MPNPKVPPTTNPDDLLEAVGDAVQGFGAAATLEAVAELAPDESTAWARQHIGRVRNAAREHHRGGRVWGHHNPEARVCRCAACVLRRASKGGETPESVAAAKKWQADNKKA